MRTYASYYACCGIAHSLRHDGSIPNTNSDSNMGAGCDENGDTHISAHRRGDGHVYGLTHGHAHGHTDEYTHANTGSNPDPQTITESVAR